jgi:hypothetical protein
MSAVNIGSRAPACPLFILHGVRGGPLPRIWQAPCSVRMGKILPNWGYPSRFIGDHFPIRIISENVIHSYMMYPHWKLMEICIIIY